MTSNRSSDRALRLALPAALLFAAACSHEAPPVAQTSVSAPVEVARAGTIPDVRVTTGTVRSETVSPIAAKVIGNVVRVLVNEGQRVNRGDLLVEIDSREGQAKTDQAKAGSAEVEEQLAAARAAVSAAQANADLANATFRRYSVLRERGSVSPQEFEEISARRSGADAQLAEAQRTLGALAARQQQARAGISEAETFLSYSELRAPISGIVTARHVDPGAQAMPGMPLVTIEDDSRYRVETTVDESLAGSVRPGDTVTIDGGGTPLAATVTNVEPSVDAATRSALVKIALPPHTTLHSGAFVRVAFPVGQRNGITVPAAAVARNGQLASVFVVGDDGTAHLRLVTLGDRQRDRVEVLSGIDDGEKVVAAIRSEVRDGVKIVATSAGRNTRGGAA